jgi:hypothetical protein
VSRFWRQRLTELAILAVGAVLFAALLAIGQLIVYGHVSAW